MLRNTREKVRLFGLSDTVVIIVIELKSATIFVRFIVTFQICVYMVRVVYR